MANMKIKYVKCLPADTVVVVIWTDVTLQLQTLLSW